MADFILHPERNGKRQLERLTYPRFIIDIPIKDIELFYKGEGLRIENPIFIDNLGNVDIPKRAKIMREAGDFVNNELSKYDNTGSI